MQLGRRLTTGFLGLLLAVGIAPAAQAQDPVPTTLTLRGAAQKADSDTLLRAELLHDDGTPVVGAELLLERRVGGEWQEIETLLTDDLGRAEAPATMSRRPLDNVFRASYAGDLLTAPSTSGRVPVELVRRSTRVVLGGPDSVVDETSVTLTVRWRTGSGTPVPGQVRVYRRDPGKDWKLDRRLRTGEDGVVSFTTKPRVDTRWRAKAAALAWAKRDVSPVHAVDNLPPGTPVSLPAAAPNPRVKLPAQQRAVGDGPHAVVTRIPNGVWNNMTGRSWHRGCPVGRAGLRLLRINYWDYKGYRRRGELVARADAIDNMAGALKEMYHRKLPIRSMYRVDRFGWSRTLGGANDYRSMAAGNTSAFNCRGVVGNPSVRSPHSYGRSLDINPWENPYRSRDGWTPNTWWVSHSHPRVAWRSRSHQVVQLMSRHGLRWTYGTSDAHHFDASGSSARMLARWADCDGVVCH